MVDCSCDAIDKFGWPNEVCYMSLFIQLDKASFWRLEPSHGSPKVDQIYAFEAQGWGWGNTMAETWGNTHMDIK